MKSLHWFRNDLRLRDNPALAAAAKGAEALACVFVVDPGLLAPGAGARRGFLAECLEELAAELESRGQALLIREGDPATELAKLCEETGASAVHWNRSTTPLGRRRDRSVRELLEAHGVEVTTHKGGVVFEGDEIRSSSGRGYAVYSPYKRAWRTRWQEEPPSRIAVPRFPPSALSPRGDADFAKALLRIRDPETDPAGRDLQGGEKRARARLRRFLDRSVADYAELRDRPDLDATSRLSPYLRFGAISVVECVRAALARAEDEPAARSGAEKWVDELIWRDFYAAVMEASPHVVGANYRREFDAVAWDAPGEGFEAWKEGRTGFPIVDAGMRQLRESGWMHNRVRMVVASFLTKDLGIHWLPGERWFAERLVDYDPASNNGGWQWSASTGTDAQPWFRIFNPTRQAQRFDPNGDYVRRWVPELAGIEGARVHEPEEGLFRGAYPPPIVDHAEARRRTLARFEAARSNDK